MKTVLAQAALSYDGECHDVADLVLTGLITGHWQLLEAVVARGLSVEAERSAEISAEDLERALASFRYERRLIAAAELREWLSQRSLRVDDLSGVLRRRLLRERFESVTSLPATPRDVARVMRAEAICGGALAQYADELRSWHAACDALAEPEPGSQSAGPRAAASVVVEDVVAAALVDAPSGLETLGATELGRRTTRLAALQAGYARFRASAVPERAVDERLAARRLEWTTVTGNELVFEREGAARETLLRVVHDGGTLAEVAGMLNLEPVHRELELGSAPAELSSQLLIAREGDLIGPWSEDECWRVLEIGERFEPASTADGRARARAELFSELIERVAAGKAGVLAAL